MSELLQRRAATEAIARDAGLLARHYYDRRDELSVDVKGVQDFVSVADQAVETLIRERLAQLFPGEAILGEEGGGADTDGPLWIIDPIDGTSNFLRGIPQWGIIMAYCENRRAKVGVIYDPVHDLMYAATENGGAFCNGRPIHVQGPDVPFGRSLSISYVASTPIDVFLTMSRTIMEQRIDLRRIGSSAIALTHVAAGRMSAHYASRSYSWDAVAGLLIAKEAGGTVWPFNNGGSLEETSEIVVCSPGLEDLMNTLRTQNIGV